MRTYLSRYIFILLFTFASVNIIQAAPPDLGNSLVSRVTALEDTLAEAQIAIGTLQSELASAQNTISSLQNSLNTANSNISSLQSAVIQNGGAITDLQGDLTTLVQTVAGLDVTVLESRVAAIENNTVLELDGLLFFDNASGYATAMFHEVNIQIVNGTGATTSITPPNGLGNLIVGYNEARIDPALPVCVDGQYADQISCEAAGEIWATNHKSGSHNIVVGRSNSYSSSGGVVAGSYNAINRQGATVIGGEKNIASGFFSSVTSGIDNIASGNFSSVTGGQLNIASGNRGSVSAGLRNTASGLYSSVNGGRDNTASGSHSSVLGGVGENSILPDQTIPALP